MFIIKKDKVANISRTIRFTDNMFERLQLISQNENLSFNSLVLQCCNYAMNEYVDFKNKNDKIKE